MFNIDKKAYSQSYNLGVDIRYWPSYQVDNQQKSGAYIFRVKEGVKESLRYSALVGSPISYKTSVVQQLTFRFSNSYKEEAVLRLRIFPKLATAEWDLDLKGIPLSNQGQEVILVFNSDLQNDNTFYTDSNGLEMQQRVLNYRPTWDFSSNEVATVNYYPINSAILIKDETTQD